MIPFANRLLLGLAFSASRYDPLLYPGEEHLLLIGKPGSGKSECWMKPNLARYTGSALVLDFMGNLAKSTALYRQAVMGHDVYVVDSFGIVPWKRMPKRRVSRDAHPNMKDPVEACYGRFDPVRFVLQSSDPLTAAMQVAEAFVIPESHEAYWARAGQQYFAAFLLFVAKGTFINNDDERTLASVWDLMTDPEFAQDGLKQMLQCGIPFCERIAHSHLTASKTDREFKSIRQQVYAGCINLFSEPSIMKSLTGTNIGFSAMNKRPITAYLCMPGYLALSHNRFNRFFINCALSEIERAGLRKFDEAIPPTVIFMDEFATLGYFPSIVEAMGRGRNWGGKFVTCVQNLSQLNELYKQGWTSIPGTSSVQHIGGTNDVFTAEYLSKLMGIGTEKDPSISNGTRPDSGTEGERLFGRPVFMPDEIMRYQGDSPVRKTLIKLTGKQPSEGMLFAPGLADFPDVIAFYEAIDNGYSPEYAARLAAYVRDSSIGLPEPEEPKRLGLQLHTKPRKPFRPHTLDRAFAWLIGDEAPDEDSY